MRILAVDVGAGTQDILVYESGRPVENCPKLVLPSQTQLVGKRIRAVTASGNAVHLSGVLMGGGESSSAAMDHLAAGLPLTATPEAAKTLHNDLDRVRGMGVELRSEAPPDAVVVKTGDIDLSSLGSALETFGIALPDVVAVAVQDHGDAAIYERINPPPNRPPSSGTTGGSVSVANRVRFDYLQSLLDDGGRLDRMVFQTPPPGMTRMQAIAHVVPGAYLMDTGAAAVLGVRGDPVAREQIDRRGAVVVNLGNMHTFAALVRGDRLYGLFEHHTHGMTAELLGDLVSALQRGELNVASFTERFDGHGAAFSDDYSHEGPFPFVVVTGPNRRIARPLGYYEAAPFGDMMLSGAFGLVDAVARSLNVAIPEDEAV